VPIAVVVWREEADDGVAAWCRERLAAFKVPKAFISLESLPRNANGKVDRRALAALIG